MESVPPRSKHFGRGPRRLGAEGGHRASAGTSPQPRAGTDRPASLCHPGQHAFAGPVHPTLPPAAGAVEPTAGLRAAGPARGTAANPRPRVAGLCAPILPRAGGAPAAGDGGDRPPCQQRRARPVAGRRQGGGRSWPSRCTDHLGRHGSRGRHAQHAGRCRGAAAMPQCAISPGSIMSAATHSCRPWSGRDVPSSWPAAGRCGPRYLVAQARTGPSDESCSRHAASPTSSNCRVNSSHATEPASPSCRHSRSKTPIPHLIPELTGRSPMATSRGLLLTRLPGTPREHFVRRRAVGR